MAWLGIVCVWRCDDGRTGRVVVSGLGWWYGVVSKRDTTTQNLLRAYRLQRQGGGGGGLFASSYVFCILPCISLFFLFFHQTRKQTTTTTPRGFFPYSIWVAAYGGVQMISPHFGVYHHPRQQKATDALERGWLSGWWSPQSVSGSLMASSSMIT